MQLKPHIVHIVGHTEAHHATTAAELIEACRITDGAISQCLLGLPDMTGDPRVQRRKDELLADAGRSARRHRRGGPRRPVHRCRRLAAQLKSAARRPASARQRRRLRQDRHPHGRGACVAVEPATGHALLEAERIVRVLAEAGALAAS